jgi:hypothetical protein
MSDATVQGRFDGAAATILAQSGGIASIVNTAAGNYLITRGANTGGWDTLETIATVTVEGAVPHISSVQRVDDDSIRVFTATNAGVLANVTFSLTITKIS